MRYGFCVHSSGGHDLATAAFQRAARKKWSTVDRSPPAATWCPALSAAGSTGILETFGATIGDT